MEEPLPPGGSCLLGSINLSEFVTKEKTFNIDDFNNTVIHSVIALNEVLDEGLELHPLQEQRDSVRDWRQIGLGIFGLADMLIKMGLKYGDKESISLCDGIAFNMINTAIETSALLAKEKGVYPKCNISEIMETDFFKDNTTMPTKNLVYNYGLYNSQLLTIAPTGSLSTMLNVSGGIEPIYANSYTRKTESLHKDGIVEYKVYTPIVKKYMEENNIKDEKELPDYFITSQELNFINRIDMQSVWQRHIDASISSTVNVSNDFTIVDVENLYLYAWKKNLKGVTIFRDGCSRSGILTTENSKKENPIKKDVFDENTLTRGFILDTVDDLIGKKRKLTSGCGSLHVLTFFDPINGKLLETYLNKGSTGGCNNFMVGLSRMLSLSARAGVDTHTIAEQLNSSGTCPSYSVRRATKKDTSKGGCCPSAIANALLEMQQEIYEELGINEQEYICETHTCETSEEDNLKYVCPECGSDELIFSGGCNSCNKCGYSKCG